MQSRVTTAFIVVLYLVTCEIAEYLLVHGNDSEMFPPKIGVRLLRWLGIGFCIAGISSSYKSSNWTLIICVLVLILLLHRPRTLLIDSSGISSCGAFGLFRRAIPWVEVDQVSSDWQEEDFRFWTFMGYGVTVMGRDGRRIEHGLFNADQARFLNALRRFVPREAFDAGLYEWHPEAPAANS
jgi:hypothetical protein